MNCDEARDLIDAYALGALELEDHRRLEAHLRTCVAECPQLLADAREVTEALALAVPLRQPPATLRARVMAAGAESADQTRDRTSYGAGAAIPPARGGLCRSGFCRSQRVWLRWQLGSAGHRSPC